MFRRQSENIWEQLRSTDFTNRDGAVSDVIVAGKGTQKHYYAAFWGDQVYFSSGGNPLWEAVPGIDNRQNRFGRIILATSDDDPTVIFALCDNGNLYRWEATGGVGGFKLVAGVPKALFSGNQGWYDIVLAVDPTDSNTVYLGGDLTQSGAWTSGGSWDLSFYKGKLKLDPVGQTFRFPFESKNDITNGDSSKVPSDATWIGQDIHPDIHTLAFATKTDGTHDARIVWLGTDGGLFRSTQSGLRGSFLPCNLSEAVVQMTYLAQRYDTDAVVIGGCQDNGLLRYWGDQAWDEVFSGDGGGVAIDPLNPMQILHQTYHTGLYRSTIAGGKWRTEQLIFPPITTKQQQALADTESKKTGFYSPIAVPPVESLPPLPTVAAFGTNRLWLTQDWGTNWVTLPSGTNPYTFTNNILEQDVLDDSVIRDIFFQDYDVLYVATEQGVWQFIHDSSSDPWRKTALPTTQ